MDTQVIIAGAGPTGLTLAVDLGMRGVRCILLEQKEAPQFLPNMERCNARSMEIYRRMGIAEKVRAAGLPARCPMDVFIVLSLVEPPLLHLPYPSVEQARQEIAACNDGTLPLEPYQLISQYTLEPLLKSIAEQLPSVCVRYGCEVLGFDEVAGSVPARRRRSARAISSAATADRASCASSLASRCAARATSCSCARRSIAATSSLSASPSARAATITSPTTARPS